MLAIEVSAHRPSQRWGPTRRPPCLFSPGLLKDKNKAVRKAADEALYNITKEKSCSLSASSTLQWTGRCIPPRLPPVRRPCCHRQSSCPDKLNTSPPGWTVNAGVRRVKGRRHRAQIHARQETRHQRPPGPSAPITRSPRQGDQVVRGGIDVTDGHCEGFCGELKIGRGGVPSRFLTVGWVKVAQASGGAAQTDQSWFSALWPGGPSCRDRSPTRTSVCLTHPTSLTVGWVKVAQASGGARNRSIVVQRFVAQPAELPRPKPHQDLGLLDPPYGEKRGLAASCRL